MDEEAVAAEAAQVKGAVMKPWMIAVLVSVVVILTVAGILWLRSRKRKGEESQEIEGAAAAGALASAGDEAGDEAGAESAESGEAAESVASADAPASAEASTAVSEAPAAPDLLADAEQISEEEIDAGRTAALRKMLEERGKQ